MLLVAMTDPDGIRWEREKRILNLRSTGMSYVDIAGREKCDPKTVQSALKNIYKRYVDLMVLDGANSIAELIMQADQMLTLAMGAFSKASRVTSVLVEGGSGERVNIEQPDWNARSLFLGHGLSAIRLKATIMGLNRTDVAPIFNMIQSQTTQINQRIGSSPIRAEDVPAIRKHLRSARALMHRAAAREIDVTELNRLAGVKQIPDREDLPGAIVSGEQDAEGATE